MCERPSLPTVDRLCVRGLNSDSGVCVLGNVSARPDRDAMTGSRVAGAVIARPFHSPQLAFSLPLCSLRQPRHASSVVSPGCTAWSGSGLSRATKTTECFACAIALHWLTCVVWIGNRSLSRAADEHGGKTKSFERAWEATSRF